ncbi:dimethylaniline monooxygenase [N-oxide-forming] 2-like [Ptychodera flava]|uniref:dimethylaniline monooxygenase [N-oxide-forming] 2-like n=1 Tax=Ptychodera flava TaxID=63121 RepID=UPI00396A9C7A
MAATKRVAIVGAGVAGLVSIKSCLEEDWLEPTCFERHDKFGGVWNYSPELRPRQGSALYDSVVSNDSKEMMTFSDFPYPKENTPFMPHPMVLRHIQNYAQHFDLEKHIRFNTDVIDVQRNNDGKYWKLQIKDKDDKLSTEEFDYVMICTSAYNKAFVPSYPGRETFKGTTIHSNEYREPSKFRGKRVVVVGGSHSGGEISSEIARNGAEVYLSMRHGVWFLPRICQNGLPYDICVFRRSSLTSGPKLMAEMEKVCQTRIGDHRKFGLQSKEIYLLFKASMLCDDMQDRLAQGQIKPMVDIKEFKQSDVIFKDGTTLENVDAVIFATGYDFAVPTIDDSWLYDESGKAEMYKYIFPARLEHPEKLALINILHNYGSHWPVAELQARVAARVFAGHIVLPDKATMKREIDQRIKYERNKYYNIPAAPNAEELADMLGVKPSFWRLLVKDPKLAMAFKYGPMVPYWYRLEGPGAWPEARDRILNAIENTTYALKGYPSVSEGK